MQTAEASTQTACFAVKDKEGYTACSAAVAQFEFYVADDGATLMRCPVGARESSVMCCTGVHTIAQHCAKLGCRVPEATARLAEKQSAGASGEAGKGSVMAKKEAAKKKSVVEVWDSLFQENEQRAKDGKPWTDEQLADKFRAEFPEASSPRPAMYRSFYNNGTYAFEKLGEAEKRGVPKSWKYDEKGRQIAPGKHKADDGAPADPDKVPLSKAMKKPAVAKKKLVKKKAAKASK